ncbi:hypothetical protein AS149_32155 [Burkholderia cenocepacia]|nr:hypothetical protein AS149_32155 [Burkholderia cenocepacia]
MPAGTLDAGVLKRYAGGAMDFVKKDEFSAAFPDKPLVGRQFQVTVPFERNDSSLHYSYDAEKGVLGVWATVEMNSHQTANGYPRLNYIILQQTSSYGAPVSMANAFGALKEVTPVAYRTYGIGNLSDVDMGLVPKMVGSSKESLFYDRLEQHIKLSPEDARKGVVGLEMEIQGTVASGPHQAHPVVCSHTKATATLDYGFEETWDECVITAKLTRVIIRSPSLGVIGDWRAQAAKKPAHKS